ncbi:hypothetical protein [Hymenobacter lucidus]|uniref:Uncharacterized protein n=1 Tax=Hymenobacter lucidus TaxID=2880930 RepID=A0ABS8AZB8_9BACT|nr:hypothetical protein [Hymenobacter lucidus]MCB2411135.1 hypothetical protein [Hymenobacter lucidus]
MSLVPFYSAHDAYELALLLQYHDANCRHDLADGFITSERDYVSNLATHLRYPAGTIQNSRLSSSIGLPPSTFDGPITSYTMPPAHEKVLGCDGIIILSRPISGSDEVLYKIGLFEAKWPRMFGGHQHIYRTKSGNADRWDSKYNPDTRTKKLRVSPFPAHYSHFSSQLIRQQTWSGSDVVIWEQLFSEQPVGAPSKKGFKRFGSTCVFHEPAYDFMRGSPRLNPDDKSVPNGTWKRSDLIAMLSVAKPLPIASIIFGMAVCDYGKPIVGNRTRLNILPPSRLTEAYSAAPTDNQFGNGIPINLPNPDNPAAVHQTMRELGLSNYTHITLSPEGIKRVETEQHQRYVEEHRKKLVSLLPTL